MQMHFIFSFQTIDTTSVEKNCESWRRQTVRNVYGCQEHLETLYSRCLVVWFPCAQDNGQCVEESLLGISIGLNNCCGQLSPGLSNSCLPSSIH